MEPSIQQITLHLEEVARTLNLTVRGTWRPYHQIGALHAATDLRGNEL